MHWGTHFNTRVYRKKKSGFRTTLTSKAFFVSAFDLTLLGKALYLETNPSST